jgi:diguanylate cyclase (GGDEF)-like protein/PAS domain S-box-containing protein
MNQPVRDPASVAALAMDEGLFAGVFDRLDVGLAIYDVVAGEEGAVRFRFAAVNARALEIARVSANDVLGRLLLEVFPGAARMGIFAALERVHRTGRDESLPPMHYEDERIEGWYRNDVYRLDCGRLMVAYVDVTEDVRSKAALKESETRYELLTESLADGIYDWDLADDTVYFSPSWKAQLGYADNELENSVSVWQDLLHPDQRDRVLGELDAFLKGEQPVWETEFQLRHKAGHYIWIHTRATPVRDETTGRIVRLLGVHIDVDAKLREQAESERHRATIDALFTALPDLFFLLDGDGVVLDFHASKDALLDRAPDEFIGQPMQQVLPPEVAVDFLAAMQEARSTDYLAVVEYTLPMVTGLRHYEGRILHTKDDQFAIIVRDITSRRVAEEELQHRVRENEALSQLYRVAQNAQRRRDMLRRSIIPIACGLGSADHVQVAIEIDGQRENQGSIDEQAHRIVSPIFDGARTRGRIEVIFDAQHLPRPQERTFLNTASQVVGVWLRGHDARRGLQIYERIVANTNDQIALLDRNLQYRVVNPAFAHRLGLNASNIVGRSLREILDESTFERVAPRLKRSLAGRHVNFQEWRESPQGRRYFNVLYSPYREDGEINGVIVSLNDITELHEAQGQLRRAARVFISAAEAVLMIDGEGTIDDANPAFERICGYRAEEAVGRNIDLLSVADRTDHRLDRAFEHAIQEGSWRGEVWSRRKDGEVIPCLMTISQVEDDLERPDGFVCVFSDISDFKRHERRLEVLAHHDTLTGLPNRAMLARHLENRVRRHDGHPDPFTIMFLDLDHFKPVNDQFGHSEGDKLLQRVADRLRDVLRVDDLLARVGGDEFVAVLPGTISSANASVVADKIIAKLREPFTIRGEEVRIGVSVGISAYPEDGRDADSLLRSADMAMYEAKAAGRNTWRSFDPKMNSSAKRHWELVTELSGARDRGEQYMVYQPKFDASGREILGLEALMRWTHPELGVVPPVEFIEAGEQGGLIAELDHWALDRAVAQLRKWLDQGLDPPLVSVNISGRTLNDRRFIEKLSATLRSHDIQGDRLRLEVSEHALNACNEAQQDALAKLRQLGVSASIDDFGSEFSSLIDITRFSVQEIKIDAEFVRDAITDSRARSVVEAIVAIGRSLGLEVVAEGVEDAEHANWLETLAPLTLQGHYFRKPMDVGACTDALRQRIAESNEVQGSSDRPDHSTPG